MRWFARTGAVVAVVAVGVFIYPVPSAQTPAAPKSALFDSARLVEDLRTLSADDMQGREVGTAGGAKARAFVISRFKASGVDPVGADYEMPFQFAERQGATSVNRTGVNVVGRIAGTRTPGRYLVVSAHYDHVGIQHGQVYHGADDNASGTAALFSIAAYFVAHRPANSLLVVAFDAEEEGLWGSRAFVRSPPVDRDALVVDLNADMIGREPDNRLFVVGALRQPLLKPPIQRVATHVPVKLLMGHEDPSKPDDDWIDESDQFSFIQAGIPGLYFGVEDYAQHHQPTDEFETITFDFYVRAVETMIQVVKEFDADAASLVAPGKRAF